MLRNEITSEFSFCGLAHNLQGFYSSFANSVLVQCSKTIQHFSRCQITGHRRQYVEKQSPRLCKNTVNWSQLYWFDPAKTNSNGLTSDLVPIPCFLLEPIPMHASGALCCTDISSLLLLSAFMLEHYLCSSCRSGCTEHGRVSRWGVVRCESIGKG